jgi:hypothetical protein
VLFGLVLIRTLKLHRLSILKQSLFIEYPQLPERSLGENRWKGFENLVLKELAIKDDETKVS